MHTHPKVLHQTVAEKVFYVIRCFLRDLNNLLLTLQCEHVLNHKVFLDLKTLIYHLEIPDLR